MPRAIVMPAVIEASRRRKPANDSDETYTAGPGATAPNAASKQDGPAPDDYGSRLAKYIPVEALAGLLIATGLSGDASKTRTAAIAAVGLVGAILWALTQNNKLGEDDRQPSLILVGFTLVAFVGWALGTSAPVRDLIGLGPVWGATILGAVAFLLPLVDNFIVSLALREKEG